MKHLKIGFAAIVALIAMSFTLVSTETGLKKFAVADGCYTSLNNITPPTGSNPNQDYETVSPPVSTFPATPGGSEQFTEETSLEELKDAALCPGQGVFCCYRVVNNQITHIIYKTN